MNGLLAFSLWDTSISELFTFERSSRPGILQN